MRSSLETRGPISLHHTMFSGQTSQPPWYPEGKKYLGLVYNDGEPCPVRIWSEKDPDFIVFFEYPSYCRGVDEQVSWVFSIDDDLYEIYSIFRNDPHLTHAAMEYKGLRLFKSSLPEEGVFSSIASSNNSVTGWTRSIEKLKEKMGRRIMGFGKILYSFPQLDKIASAPAHLLEETKLGYRARYFIQSARMILREEVLLSKISSMKYENAREYLMKLPGVGPKVADCILLYTYGFKEAFPVDLWIRRIVSDLYAGKDLSTAEAWKLGRRLFGKYAGYAQLYLYHYARKKYYRK